MAKVTKGKTRLHSLEAAEISLVGKGANKRRFLITKSASATEGDDEMEDEDNMDEVEKKIKKADPKMMGKVSECLKGFKALPVKKDDGSEEEGAGLDDDCQTAVRAAVRLLSSVKDKVSPQLMHQVLDIAGYGMPEDLEPKMAGFQALPAKVESEQDDVFKGYDVKKGDLHKAAEAAQNVYKEYLAKLGYQKYPVGVMTLKTGGEPKTNLEGETVSKSDNADVLSGLTPEAREKVEAVFKSNAELITKQAELVAKTAQLEKAAQDRDAKDRKREIVAKAAGYKHLALPQEEIVSALEAGDKAGVFEQIAKSFDALDKQAATSELFSEKGYTAQGGNDAANAMAKLEKMAEGLVQKSEGGMTPEQAFTKVLETKEGKALYAEHQKARGGI